VSGAPPIKIVFASQGIPFGANLASSDGSSEQQVFECHLGPTGRQSYTGGGGLVYCATLDYSSSGSSPGPPQTISAQGSFSGDVTITFGAIVERT
jgi:hypothetical protein